MRRHVYRVFLGSSGFTARPARAFTLIELLVVITLVVALIAMLLPQLSQARDQAKKVVCLSQLRQIGTCIHNYASSNNQWGMGAYRGNPELLLYGGGANTQVYLGTLMSSGFIPLGSQMVYCPNSSYAPSWKQAQWSKTVTQEKNWSTNQATVCSYTTNPNISAYTTGTGSDAYAPTRGKLSVLPGSLAMVSDWFGAAVTDSTYGTCPRNHTDYTFNYVRVDGVGLTFVDTNRVIKTAVDGTPNTGQIFALFPK